MKAAIPKFDCLCASFRRAARTLTQHYEEALRPLGIRATQFTVLQALSIVGAVPQGKLGEILAMDSTTLTRTLAIMRREGWIEKKRGKDGRERSVALANAGKEQFARALPVWQKVQTKLRRKLGNERWESLLNVTHQVAQEVTTQGDLS
jgi:DNA-binding MarR family transcriptional regulator